MEQPSSGVKFYIKSHEEGWLPLEDAYLREATSYEWKLEGESNPVILFNGIPLPFVPNESEVSGTLHTPFQSGEATIELSGTYLKTYIYTDERKMTTEHYEIMLGEILEEAAVCFDYSGLDKGFNTSGRERTVSWTQWSYIKRSFHELSLLFQKINSHPLSVLKQENLITNREKIQLVHTSTSLWLERNHGRTELLVPKKVWTLKRQETNDLYENRLVKKQLLELRHLLSKYRDYADGVLKEEAEKLRNKVLYWLNHSFLNDIKPYNGQVTITQRLRKHPIYRKWHTWFEKLYKHQKYEIGFEYHIPLKDTFQVYEMWCYMKLIKQARQNGELADSSQLYKTTSDGIFLSLAENKESTVKLKNGDTIAFQRVFQYRNPENVAANTKALFYTFTQRMIPDIVIQREGKLFIYDPKYRVPNNIGTALGEMHKYRDGIRNIFTDEIVVEEVYIMTPFQESGEELRYYADQFHQRYKMGAVKMMPGVTEEHDRNSI
ncbi:hypothetical protein ABE65_012315 [Fictibacillus phosphorivorans]|uniref:DUF2357 domain-containing protein n=1 Tax=Fictibacillus phosphorivorans TaxID=1221500 RepID=A0A160IMG8_9BACL|nr:DUF2357 domain-containing protein [Fictibacillus phosphorivorans]ANC77538.1 hypothetical protein ABE65_012315 [Fictibacillus phosphorivorans]